MVLACSATGPLNVLPNGGSSRSPITLLKGEKAEFESKLFLAEKAYQGATDCAAYGTDDEGFLNGKRNRECECDVRKLDHTARKSIGRTLSDDRGERRS
jgi:hypothetical protein